MNASDDEKVQFLICGAQKAGTTALVSYLKKHPLLQFPICKEPHFFDCEDLDWQTDRSQRDKIYKQHFDDQKNKLKGESTPIYLYWQPAPKRIWNYNPYMRMIVILRNPITRAYSHWNMEVLRGREKLNFLEALQREPERRLAAAPLQDRIFSYTDRGFYSEQLKRLWGWFGPASTLVLRQDDLLSKPEACLNQVYQHLGIAAMPFEGDLTRHALHYANPLPLSARTWLQECFKEEISRLEALLGWDCSDWLEMK